MRGVLKERRAASQPRSSTAARAMDRSSAARAWVRFGLRGGYTSAMWKFLRQSVLIMGVSAAVGYMPEAVAQTKPAKKPRPTAKKTQPSVKQASDSLPKAPEPTLWPVDSPDPLPGAVLPAKRIVAFYGNPLSKR